MKKEALGVYLSEAPYSKYQIKDFKSYNEASIVTTVAEVISTSEIHDKNGNKMAFINFVNQYGNIKGVCFTSYWTKKRC